MEISRIGERARLASAALAGASTDAKNACLARLAALLEENCADIVAVNAADAERGSDPVDRGGRSRGRFASGSGRRGFRKTRSSERAANREAAGPDRRGGGAV